MARLPNELLLAIVQLAAEKARIRRAISADNLTLHQDPVGNYPFILGDLLDEGFGGTFDLARFQASQHLPPLMLVCRAWYHECLPQLYHTVFLRADTRHVHENFVNTILRSRERPGRFVRALVMFCRTRVELDWDTQDSFDGWTTAFSEMPNLAVYAPNWETRSLNQLFEQQLKQTSPIAGSSPLRNRQHEPSIRYLHLNLMDICDNDNIVAARELLVNLRSTLEILEVLNSDEDLLEYRDFEAFEGVLDSLELSSLHTLYLPRTRESLSLTLLAFVWILPRLEHVVNPQPVATLISEGHIIAPNVTSATIVFGHKTGDMSKHFPKLREIFFRLPTPVIIQGRFPDCESLAFISAGNFGHLEEQFERARSPTNLPAVKRIKIFLADATMRTDPKLVVDDKNFRVFWTYWTAWWKEAGVSMECGDVKLDVDKWEETSLDQHEITKLYISRPSDDKRFQRPTQKPRLLW